MNTLNTILDRAAEIDLITSEEEAQARQEIKQASIKMTTNNPNIDRARIEALAVHLGQNESFYLDSAGANKLAPAITGEDPMTHRMRADAMFRVRRAMYLIEAVDSLTAKK